MAYFLRGVTTPNEIAMLAFGHEAMVNECLMRERMKYHDTVKRPQTFDFACCGAYKPRLRPDRTRTIRKETAWPDIPSSRTSCTARGGRTPRSRNYSAS